MDNKISIYIHWPFCKAKCPYCDFNSHVSNNVDIDDFNNAYLKEIDFFSEEIKEKTIQTIFIGGGTPSLMPPFIIENIINKLSSLTDLAENIEITLEANPTSVEIQKFLDFKKVGVNRVSIGIQSFDEQSLKFLGREHSVNEAIKAIEVARTVFDRYSFDLIYARPQQTLKQWEQELNFALNFVKDHISLYQLTIEKGTKFFSMHNKGKFIMPNQLITRKFYDLTEEITQNNELFAYEISNYAKLGGECKHNLNYWHYNDYLGIGAGAHSRINKQAIMMISNPENWLKNIKQKGNAIQNISKLSIKEQAEEMLLMSLRLKEGLNKKQFENKIGAKIDNFINKEAISYLIKEKLLYSNKNYLYLTYQGRLLLNSVINYIII